MSCIFGLARETAAQHTNTTVFVRWPYTSLGQYGQYELLMRYTLHVANEYGQWAVNKQHGVF